MKKGLILALLLVVIPVNASAFQVGRLEMASTVKITSQYSTALIDAKVGEIFEDINSENANKFREDLKNAKLEGSGVMITYDGCVLTSAHVLQDQDFGLMYEKPVLHYGTDLKTEPVNVGALQVVYISRTNDLAVACLLDNKGKFFHPATINYDIKDLPLPLGTDVYALGFPSVYGEYVKLVKGMVSGYLKDLPLMTTNMAFSAGMSGGPVFDMSNKLISLVTARSLDFSFGVILDVEKFLNWRNDFYTDILTVDKDIFAGCNPQPDNYFEKNGQKYYEADCKTKVNYGLNDQIVNDYKNFCGKTAVLEDHNKRQMAQYIASGKTNMLELHRYLEWLCWQK